MADSAAAGTLHKGGNPAAPGEPYGIDPQLSLLLDQMTDGMLILGQDSRLIYVNPAFTQLLGISRQALEGHSFSHNLPEESQATLRSCLFAYHKNGKIQPSFEIRMFDTQQRAHTLECVIQPLKILGRDRTCVSVRDISGLERATERNRHLSSALEQIADSVIMTNAQGMIEYVNHGFTDITGYTANETIGRSPAFLKSGHHDKVFYQRMWQDILQGKIFRDVVVNRRKNGEMYYEEKTITPLRNEKSEITHFVSTGKDITEHVTNQQRLQYLAQHDLLTGLPNRVLLQDRLEQAISTAKRKHTGVALIFMDLDRFKNLNDTLGHNAGDSLLKYVAARLRKSLREGDTIAHFSADEFVIMIPDIKTEKEIMIIADSVLESIRHPFVINSMEMFFTASMGIAKYPECGQDASSLTKYAEIAMYQAKYLNGNCYQFYNSDMNNRADERLLLESELRYAIQRKEFEIFYQPQIRNDDHKIMGVEALIRWNHPARGLVLPSEFIGLLEESGLIEQVGEWILETACQQLRKWHDDGVAIPQVSVNVSPKQLTNGGFTNMVQRILDQTKVPPACLELEITESCLVHNEAVVVAIFKQLGEMGVGLAMDDFGTGYSSLRYLREFPVKTLKIDRDFVKNVPASTDDCSLATAIVSMGHSLHMNVVAEGVETLDQLGFLQTQGCDITQGYYFSHPLTADNISGLQLNQAMRSKLN